MQLALDPVTVARWQFGITTVYHYLFVPLTIGLSFMVAGFQTAWHRTGGEKYYRLTKFWGKLFLINFALGLVTGIVQEFQFGMNWSDYSRFVGDVFGAPLAMEALLAFFLESTFLGLWIFGWDRLPKRLHLASIWLLSIGTVLSAYFILAANSFMQHPVGYRYNPVTKRAELTGIWAVLSNDTAVSAFFHVISGAFLVAGAFLVGISCWHLRRDDQADVFRPSLRLGLVTLVIAGVGVSISGDLQGKLMFKQQPMKMASAEALWDTQCPAPFSIFAYGNVGQGRNTVAVEMPRMLSFLANSDFTSCVPGINETQAAERAAFGPGDYRPWIPLTYWSFRWMIGFGMASAGVGVLGLWFTRRGRTPDGKWAVWMWRVGLWTIAFPFIGNAWGWIFTETGRQPWAVYGLLRTRDAVTPSNSTAQILTSLITFALLYGALAVVEMKLMLQYAKAGANEVPPDLEGDPGGAGPNSDRPLAFAY